MVGRNGGYWVAGARVHDPTMIDRDAVGISTTAAHLSRITSAVARSQPASMVAR
jgi:hypothetical protein